MFSEMCTRPIKLCISSVGRQVKSWQSGCFKAKVPSLYSSSFALKPFAKREFSAKTRTPNLQVNFGLGICNNMDDSRSILLSSGYRMPKLGLGTWTTQTGEEMAVAIETAIAAGYRHIDTAFVYENEKHIGSALKKIFAEGKVKREDLFVVSKLPSNGHNPKYVEYFCKKSLAALQLDYIDMYLIHSPISSKKTENDMNFMAMENGVFQGEVIDFVETWKAMEALVDGGLVRSIGLSNFNSEQIQNIVDNSRIKPANLQVECHVYLPQYELHDFCKRNKIAFTAYSPLGTPALHDFAKKNYGITFENKNPHLLSDPKLKPLIEKHNKTSAQILLRYLVQRGMIAIPKSTNPQRIKENIQVFDFELSDEDMNVLKAMKTGFRYFLFDFMPGMKEHPNYPFNIPY